MTQKDIDLMPLEYRYALLGRLKSDCDYYLGYGYRSTTNLWARTEKEQIATMRKLLKSVPEAPEWLTEADINNYALAMGVK